ncbi:uncharacterized protein LOC131605528 [Vicia villosa]|uniref:uncharacterized protein LOC131605528 n=1 Tax=Vicia villosa TaxID=3911 RepID=UPI00273B7BD2|nr:uncharacterized protein LOC131605528 [Vicia villosa]
MSSSSNDEINMVTPPNLETQTPPPSSSAKPKFHPSLDVSNVRNNIHIVLDTEIDCYGILAELFQIHVHSHQVLHHIVSSDNKTPPPVTDPTYDHWATLDVIVLKWIYYTILVDLQTTIIKPDSMALATWTHLANIFQDN